MNSFDELKTIWQRQPANEKSDPASAMRKTRSLRMNVARKQLFTAASLFLTFLFLMYGLFSFEIKEQTTFAGLFIVILTVLIYAALSFLNYRRLKKMDVLADPSLYLGQMRNYYRYRQKANTLFINAYYFLLNAGMGLYMIEFLKKMPWWMAITFLTIYAGWMLFAIFYLGRRSIHREFVRLQQIIDSLQEAKKNLEQQ